MDLVYRFITIFGYLAACNPTSLTEPVLIALIVGGVGTVALGTGSFFYVWHRKEMSGEYCGGKAFDTFGKTLFPHAFAFAIAFALGGMGVNAQGSYLGSAIPMAVLEFVFILLGYFVLLFVYFLTPRLGKWQWIIAGSIAVLAIVLFTIGVCVPARAYIGG